MKKQNGKSPMAVLDQLEKAIGHAKNLATQFMDTMPKGLRRPESTNLFERDKDLAAQGAIFSELHDRARRVVNAWRETENVIESAGSAPFWWSVTVDSQRRLIADELDVLRARARRVLVARLRGLQKSLEDEAALEALRTGCPEAYAELETAVAAEGKR